ncbi:MAG: dihydroorotate dehydrogenase-like protein [Prolixibacteraceae bacterium]|nr:dihydroorotate dehydrogenase-like protein [Prolixibacteraceae bacterium]
MANLATSYMGIPLKSPVILGASNLVEDQELIGKAVDAGIGAVVYKSLFEEQVQLESLQLDEELHEYDYRNAEMEKIFPEIEHAGAEEHVLKLQKFKEKVKVPVIASLNAIYNVTWVEYTRQLAEAGVDGLELNFYRVPVTGEANGSEIENHQLHVLKEVKKAVKIPVSVKLSPFYSNPLNFIEKIDKAGADGIVLFNRFFQPDIDINKEEFHFPWELTKEGEYKETLRYTGLLYGNVKAGIAANRGIKTGEDVVKMLLAGADAVQMVSAFYENTMDHLKKVLTDVEKWMDKKGYSKVEDFKGKFSQANTTDDFPYRRAQYVDILKNADEIFKKYPVR